jgi:predicted RNA binding protein YcfA (HicA-like mRNA interferase family)
MPKLPGVSQKEAMRALQKLGFWVARESGHVVMTNGSATVTIPRHDPINAYTMGAIVKAAGSSIEEFRKLL